MAFAPRAHRSANRNRLSVRRNGGKIKWIFPLMTDRPTQVIIIVRFSYPALGGFRQRMADMDAQREFLYAPERLHRRFFLFESLTLPALRAQTDPNYIALFLVGEDMPSWAFDRLMAGLVDLPSARIIAMPPHHNHAAISKALSQVNSDPKAYRATVRLDDDDGLDVSFIERLRTTSAKIHSLMARATPTIVSYNRGLALKLSGDRPLFISVTERMPPGSGPAMIAPPGSVAHIYDRNHRLLPQFFDTFSEAHSPAFIRTIHPDNDSQPHLSGLTHPLSCVDLKETISKSFSYLPTALRPPEAIPGGKDE